MRQTKREAGRLRIFRPSTALWLLLLFPVSAASAYSVLTHEAIIDSTWDSAIRPLLLKRFPMATAEELTQAHAYAYGGCIIQDLGYYPFGSKFFSDLTHYVRSGDFILNLIHGSQDLNEYAFALGALSFDVFQAAKGRYAPAAYKDFIGFEVSRSCSNGRSRIPTGCGWTKSS